MLNNSLTIIFLIILYGATLHICIFCSVSCVSYSVLTGASVLVHVTCSMYDGLLHLVTCTAPASTHQSLFLCNIKDMCSASGCCRVCKMQMSWEYSCPYRSEILLTEAVTVFQTQVLPVLYSYSCWPRIRISGTAKDARGWKRS